MKPDLSPDESPSDAFGQDGSGLLSRDGKSVPIQFHPLAQLFPMIEGAAFQQLVADVKERGVQRPIVLLDGMILDGRNRYMAAREAEVGYPVVEFTGSDPVAFVISENIHRRHMTDSQRAMVAARIAKLNREDNLIQNRTADLPIGVSTAQAAEALHVAPRTVTAARAVVRDGAPELVAAVDAGQVTVSAAAEVASLPKEEQAAIVAEGPAAVRAAAKELRQPTVQEPKREPNGLSGLSREGLEDEVLGLRDENAELRKERDALKAERDTLNAQLAEATADNQGAVIGKLQKQVQAANYARDEALAATKRMEFQNKKLQARVKELEAAPVAMEI